MTLRNVCSDCHLTIMLSSRLELVVAVLKYSLFTTVNSDNGTGTVERCGSDIVFKHVWAVY